MGFKEELEARRQREEAKRYFRQNNPYYFSSQTWTKLILVGLALSLGCGLAYGLFTMMVHIQFSYILSMIGIVIAKRLKKISGVGNEKLGILTVILYFISLIFSHVMSIVCFNVMIGGSFMVLFNPAVWLSGAMRLFTGSVISSLFYLVGAVYAYNYACQ